MPTTVDNYIQNVIQQGDQGSALLAARTAPTLKNSNFVEVLQQGMNGLAVLRIPENHYAIVHSVGGDPNQTRVGDHAASLVERLVNQAQEMNVTPIAFANVIDSHTGDLAMLETIATALVDRANHHQLAIMNGENAILGARVNPQIQANLSGTMISIVEKIEWENRKDPNHTSIDAVAIDPQGNALYLNCDGVGTKTEFYERIGNHPLALQDFLAMNVDDAIKLGAKVQVVSGVVETNGAISFSQIEEHAEELSDNLGFLVSLQQEILGNRIQGYSPEAATYNISGSVVSLIDEARLKNPPKPSVGEYVIAIQGKPNPRSNGITGLRETMIQLYGINWHQTEPGQQALQFLAEPSTILYGVFSQLLEQNQATSFYHMSGGAFDGKLAKPLVQHRLYLEMENLFEPHPIQIMLMEKSGTSVEAAYTKWPMGNCGFVTTTNPDEAIPIIKGHQLNCRIVGQLTEHPTKTGVTLTAFNGKTISYSGK